MRRCAALLLTGGLAVLAIPLPAGAAGPVPGPVRTAWYDASYPTKSAAPPAPQPGVAAGQLLVAGATVSAALLPATPLGGVTVTRPSAVAALAYVIPAGKSAATLTLTLVGGVSSAALGGRSPAGVTPLACPTTAAFVTGAQQPFDQLPAYDCSGRTSRGTLSADATSIVFSDIASVARGKDLSFVVLPGTLGPDRLVLAAPGPGSLGLLSFDSAPAFAPNGQPTPAAGAPAVPPAAPARPGAPSPFIGAAPSALGETGPQPSAAASAPAALPLAAPAVQRVSDALPRPSNRLKLLLGLALLVAGAAVLAATDRERPDRRDGAQVWGVGRHRAPRPGRAPAL